jgi:hypothetical protein
MLSERGCDVNDGCPLGSARCRPALRETRRGCWRRGQAPQPRCSTLTGDNHLDGLPRRQLVRLIAKNRDAATEHARHFEHVAETESANIVVNTGECLRWGLRRESGQAL